jgi:hypothetical protein
MDCFNGTVLRWNISLWQSLLNFPDEMKFEPVNINKWTTTTTTIIMWDGHLLRARTEKELGVEHDSCFSAL